MEGGSVPAPEFMTRDELALRLRRTTRAIDAGIAAGRIPAGVKAGGLRRLFKRAEIDQWLADGCPAVGKAVVETKGA